LAVFMSPLQVKGIVKAVSLIRKTRRVDIKYYRKWWAYQMQRQ
jgi:hypothetical protein